MEFYEKVREDNVVKYGTRVKSYIPIIVNQYSNRTHFIYEILQNAEDAEATYMKFFLYQDRIEIFHNGRPFNADDINGVCGIADGTKDDGTRIGHFGIGFKAVYGYTSTPEIYSGEYCFKIEDYLNPYEISPRSDLDSQETCMVLPFNKDGVSKEIAYKEIKDALTNKITAESILMLDSIVDIEIVVEGFAEVININKEKGRVGNSDRVYELSLLTTYENRHTEKVKENENTYLFFTDTGEEATAIIFKVNGKELEEVRNSKIYAFFPTAKEAHQNFYIHAPFDTTPARDNFKEGEDFGRHNIELVNNIGKLIYFAFCWMRDNGYLTFSGFNKVFPIYKYEEADILYVIYQNSIDIIKKGEKLLPTNVEGVYKSIDEICIPENMGIVNVFGDSDLQRLMGNRKIFWLSKEISTNAYTELKRFLDENFEFKTYEWRHLVVQMDAGFLKQKNIQWLENLMGSIESFCIKRESQNKHYIDVSEIPFVRLIDGEHICAKEKGKLQVYLNNPDICKFKIHEQCRKNNTIRGFYSRVLGIFDYDVEREVIDKILPKYANRDVLFETENHIKENIEDLKTIKDAIHRNPLVLEQVQDKYIVTDGKDWYKPNDLYIQSREIKAGYSLVRGIVDIKYLSERYFDDTVMTVRLSEDFFKKLGCSLGIKAIKTEKDVYLKAVERYCGRETERELAEKVIYKTYISKKFDWSFTFEGFPQVFDKMTPEKSREIARFLNSNAVRFDISGTLTGAEDQNFSGSHVDSAEAYSMIGLQLCFEKWIYIKENPKPQRPIDVDKDDLIGGYEPAKTLISMLPFVKVKNAISELLENLIPNKSDRELLMKQFDAPDELIKLIKAKAKSDAKLAAREEKKGSLQDRIERSNKEQASGSEREEDTELSPISEKGLEQRKKKLEEELVKSLDFKTSVARGLQFTRRSCSKEEKVFLREEYKGRCQICGTQIKKWDGNNYFEAINIIKQSELKEKYNNSVGLAWNSLCLCPNCAVQYNYCSKKISSIYEQVMEKDVQPNSDEPIEIFIELPEGEERAIKYSPRHFLVVKEAFQFFAKE